MQLPVKLFKQTEPFGKAVKTEQGDVTGNVFVVVFELYSAGQMVYTQNSSWKLGWFLFHLSGETFDSWKSALHCTYRPISGGYFFIPPALLDYQGKFVGNEVATAGRLFGGVQVIDQVDDEGVEAVSFETFGKRFPDQVFGFLFLHVWLFNWNEGIPANGGELSE